MTFFQILDSLLFKPLQLLFEVIYVFANNIIQNPGLSIIVLSLLMNFLVLPLYTRADAMQEEERDMEARLHKGVSHIKKTFRGDEKMMILQTYYRQNNYKPTYVLRGAVSLFLEIPFFISAYRFLSGLELIRGVSFGPIADLGVPDGLIHAFGYHINLLPIIMTAVNLVSCIIFTKGAAPKTKIQLYSMAVFFLFFLYTSPSGLVFYWTLNNIFSLVKTIFYKLKKPGLVLSVLVALAGVGLASYGSFVYQGTSLAKKLFIILFGTALIIPMLVIFIKNKFNLSLEMKAKPNTKSFIAGGVFLSIFIGLFIPVSVIKSSAQEFVNINHYQNPIWFSISSFCIAFGVFVIWLGIFYWLSTPKIKVVFERAIWILSGVAAIDFMLFGKNLGVLSSTLNFESGVQFGKKELIINCLAVLAAAIVLYIIARFFDKFTFKTLIVVILALVIMIPIDIVNINSQVTSIKKTSQESNSCPNYTMSKNGKNVVVVMLDRAMGIYLPYIFNEKPELKEKFDGFTAYENVISFGSCTNFGSPALFGGYEYTPLEMNKRKEEKLVDKHNESIKVMPALFGQNGYDVTVFDPVYANYQWTPDLSVYSEYPNIKAFSTKGAFDSKDSYIDWTNSNKRNFFMYGLMRSCPAVTQKYIYNAGNYYRSDINAADDTSLQTRENAHKSKGQIPGFVEAYNVLDNLPSITNISSGKNNTFLMMANDSTHDAMLLDEAGGYVPKNEVDNTEFDQKNSGRFTLNGKTMIMDNELQYMHYQSNMAALIKMGEWFDYMRKNDVYDNTRIILVADHGRNLRHNQDFILSNNKDTEFYFPLLMVKDFGAKGLNFSDEFMTNADVPTIATSGLIENAKNPFTGKKIGNEAKNGDVYIFESSDWNTNNNNGNQFNPGNWYRLKNKNMRDKNNWEFAGKNSVMPDGVK